MSQDAFDDHLQATNPCEKEERKVVEGFDLKQEQLLRSKKRNNFGETEDMRWREVYKILFPETNEQNIPSPCKCTCPVIFNGKLI